MVQADRFVNRRILATGGMATIYRAEDLKLGVDVAIKEILVQPTLSERAKSQMESRLRREAKTLSRLDHPNIVRCYGLIEDGTAPYIITEFLDGVTLEQEILSRRIVGDRAKILDVFRQVCDGLEYARHKNVVHRDIKPGNIFLCRSGQVKIIDFGIARQEDTLGITVDGQILGTPHFMSPEQAAGERGIDYRSDIFSVGSCVFLAASGTLPFDGAGHYDVENAVRFSPVPLGRVWPELEPVLLRAMAKDPTERYQSFGSFSEDLRQALASEPMVVNSREVAAVAEPSLTSTPSVDPPDPTPEATPSVAPTAPTPVLRPPAAIASRPMPTPDGRMTPVPRQSPRPSSLIATISGIASLLLFLTDNPSLGVVALLVALVSLAARAGMFSQEGRPPSPAPVRDVPPVRTNAPVYRPIPPPAAPGVSPIPVRTPAPQRMVRLRITMNGSPGESLPSTTGMFEIGRDRACHVCLPADTRVSGQHATILVMQNGLLRVTDHSSNGTLIGRRKIASADVPFGTVIRVGTTDLVVDAAFGG